MATVAHSMTLTGMNSTAPSNSDVDTSVDDVVTSRPRLAGDVTPLDDVTGDDVTADGLTAAGTLHTTPVKACSHDVNSTGMTVNKPTQLHGQLRELIGCRETRTVSARSVRVV